MTTQQPQAPDPSALKERQLKIWTAGEYARIGNPIAIMGELLCEAADLRAGQKVLDVATGSGNTALSAARRGCEVVGLDYVSQWVEYARARAEVEQMEVSFEVGDAEALPYPDGSFDAVLSTVGVMFARTRSERRASCFGCVGREGKSASRAGRPTATSGHFSAPSAGTYRRLPA